MQDLDFLKKKLKLNSWQIVPQTGIEMVNFLNSNKAKKKIVVLPSS